MDAVIATNTTISRSGVESLPRAEEEGGLSGRPVFEPSNLVLGEFRERLPEQVALIGVGGILEGSDAARKIELGADLVQFYTGFVYRGPALIADCVKAIGALRRRS
jgi:dihydroorotate dehydrogenase